MNADSDGCPHSSWSDGFDNLQSGGQEAHSEAADVAMVAAILVSQMSELSSEAQAEHFFAQLRP